MPEPWCTSLPEASSQAATRAWYQQPDSFFDVQCWKSMSHVLQRPLPDLAVQSAGDLSTCTAHRHGMSGMSLSNAASPASQSRAAKASASSGAAPSGPSDRARFAGGGASSAAGAAAGAAAGGAAAASAMPGGISARGTGTLAGSSAARMARHLFCARIHWNSIRW